MTTDPHLAALSKEERDLYDRGGIALHDLTNCALGTPGWYTDQLVRKGLWARLGKTPDGSGYMVHHYGPPCAPSS